MNPALALFELKIVFQAVATGSYDGVIPYTAHRPVLRPASAPLYHPESTPNMEEFFAVAVQRNELGALRLVHIMGFDTILHSVLTGNLVALKFVVRGMMYWKDYDSPLGPIVDAIADRGTLTNEIRNCVRYLVKRGGDLDKITIAAIAEGKGITHLNMCILLGATNYAGMLDAIPPGSEGDVHRKIVYGVAVWGDV